jgi:FkbM family methyltransferase
MAVMAFDFIANKITTNGVYELLELEQLFSLLDGFEHQFKLGTACDIGANIGNHSRYFSSKFSKVVAFEPNPLIVDILKFNTKAFTNISILEYAVGNFLGEAPIFGDQKNLGGFSVLQNRNASNRNMPEEQILSETIHVITLDSMLNDLIDLELIKIDVEGFERQVIEGAAHTIETFKPVIAFEQWPTDFVNSKSQAINLLTEMGYVFYWQTEYSTSNSRLIKYISKYIQAILGITKIYVQYSRQVPPGHYSMLLAIHETKASKIRV